MIEYNRQRYLMNEKPFFVVIRETQRKRWKYFIAEFESIERILHKEDYLIHKIVSNFVRIFPKSEKKAVSISKLKNFRFINSFYKLFIFILINFLLLNFDLLKWMSKKKFLNPLKMIEKN